MPSKMKFSFYPYTLELKHVFTVSGYSRTNTPIVLTEIEYEGIKGYGEGSMPVYLGESQESILKFLLKVDFSKYSSPFEIESILSDINNIEPGNTAAKASIDIALHDLIGKLLNKAWYDIWGYDKNEPKYTSFTIGIDTPEVVKQKTREAKDFRILKVKAGSENDKEIIDAIRSVTDVPLTVDANQGWKDKKQALDMIFWLETQNVLLVEQPMPVEMVDENAWITEHSPLPVIGDESVRRLDDVYKAKGVYTGINIKLMKCTGMLEAHKMLNLAKSLGMKVMLGCMTETSCGISAASQLAPMADWIDLDGALLIKNDLFEGMKVTEGKIILPRGPGIGVSKISGLA
ncbi:MAG: dipeptide epimerase [Ignavibacteriaceae bacterium]